MSSERKKKRLDGRKRAKDILPGGYADHLPDDLFPREQLEGGIEIEDEHTNNLQIAKEIAKDHLIEDPAYYTRLTEMEEESEEAMREWESEVDVGSIVNAFWTDHGQYYGAKVIVLGITDEYFHIKLLEKVGKFKKNITMRVPNSSNWRWSIHNRIYPYGE
jgi:hypothetical protein